MPQLVPNFVPAGGIALSTLSAVSRLLLKPVLATPRQDHTPVVVRVFRESATGIPFGITDDGDVRPLMLVQEPPLLNLGSRVRIGATPKQLGEVRRQLALEAPPVANDELPGLPPAEYQHHNGNGRASHIGADRVLVPSRDKRSKQPMNSPTRNNTSTAPKKLGDVVAQSRARKTAPATTCPDGQPDDRFEQGQDELQRQARLWSDGFGGVAAVEELVLS